jgi:hypothetical protein
MSTVQPVAQEAGQLVGAGWSSGRIGSHRGDGREEEALRNVGHRLRSGRLLPQQGERSLRVERRTPGQHLVEDRAEREDIGERPDRLVGQLLGRDVAHRAHDRPRLRQAGACLVKAAGDAEVDEAGTAVGREQDVGRLDVPMDEAAIVCVLERIGDLRRDRRRLARRQASDTRQALRERLAVDELEDDGLPVVAEQHVVDGHDVRVGEPRRCASLEAEPVA